MQPAPLEIRVGAAHTRFARPNPRKSKFLSGERTRAGLRGRAHERVLRQANCSCGRPRRRWKHRRREHEHPARATVELFRPIQSGSDLGQGFTQSVFRQTLHAVVLQPLEVLGGRAGQLDVPVSDRLIDDEDAAVAQVNAPATRALNRPWSRRSAPSNLILARAVCSAEAQKHIALAGDQSLLSAYCRQERDCR